MVYYDTEGQIAKSSFWTSGPNNITGIRGASEYMYNFLNMIECCKIMRIG